MPRIYWDTDCKAPCAGMIVNSDNPRQTVLVQTDWDYPGVASSFGWSIRNVQRCEECGAIAAGYNAPLCPKCDHTGTDGTVDCKQCGITASEFIASAADYLSDNDGATADDPGYF